jgi:hypothetical protein
MDKRSTMGSKWKVKGFKSRPNLSGLCQCRQPCSSRYNVVIIREWHHCCIPDTVVLLIGVVIMLVRPSDQVHPLGHLIWLLHFHYCFAFPLTFLCPLFSFPFPIVSVCLVSVVIRRVWWVLGSVCWSLEPSLWQEYEISQIGTLFFFCSIGVWTQGLYLEPLF